MNKLALAFVLAAASLGCDDYVEKTKYDALQKQLDETKAELAVAQQQASSCNRYREFRQGYETWRLDTMTGAACLMLAPAEAWKNNKLAGSSCN